jgi:hypothetical protein
MFHKPWPYKDRLIARMSDSSLQDAGLVSSLKRPPRSEGLHASTLLRKIHPHPAQVAREAMSEEDGATADALLRLYGLMGLAFEDRAELALLSLAKEADWPYEAFRPGEVSRDGIACSPDIILVPKPGSDEATRELSLKVSWKSCQHLPVAEEGEDGFPNAFEYYISQCQTYCMPLETTGSVLLVYFVAGAWKPFGPQVHAWELEFSSQELWENWDALMSAAQEIA